MIVYVQREAGVIVGVFTNPQPGYAEEAIDDAHPDVVAYLNPSAATLLALLKEGAKDHFASTKSDVARILRAVVLLVRDRINEDRQLWMQFKAAVAAASTFSNFQTRVAALPNTPDFTIAQVKTAILNKIDSAEAD